MLWCVNDRKRSQKDKDDKQAERQREEEQQALQQQKDLEKAAVAAEEQQAFVMPPDPTLLQYIGQSTETIKALPDTSQQAAALARSV